VGTGGGDGSRSRGRSRRGPSRDGDTVARGLFPAWVADHVLLDEAAVEHDGVPGAVVLRQSFGSSARASTRACMCSSPRAGPGVTAASIRWSGPERPSSRSGMPRPLLRG